MVLPITRRSPGIPSSKIMAINTVRKSATFFMARRDRHQKASTVHLVLGVPGYYLLKNSSKLAAQ